MDPSGYCHRKGAGLPPSAAAFLLSPLRPYCMASRLPQFSAASGFGFFAEHPQNRTGTSFLRARPRRVLRSLETSLSLLQISSLVSGPVYGFGSLRSPLGSLRSPAPCSLFPTPCFQDQAFDRLVSSSSIRYRTSTDDLSTLSSSRGLTLF